MSLICRLVQEEVIDKFSPFWFIMCMGTGISASILHDFPYPARWLRRCSYIFFALVCLLFFILQTVAVIQFIQNTCAVHKRKRYYWHTFKNMDNNVFWGTYAMGLQTIVNYIFIIATSKEVINTKHAERLMYVVYILWWYDLSVSFLIGWGITFIIWKDHSHFFTGSDIESEDSIGTKTMKESLQTALLLPVITLVVACSGSGIFIMSDLFTKTFGRNIQLVTLVITYLTWLSTIVLVTIIIGIYVWNLYVNKLPAANKIFSLFLCLGPLGQGAFGILWLTKDVKLYIDQYYPTNFSTDMNAHIAKIAVSWSFQIFGLLVSLTLISTGFFFTVLCIASILMFSRTHRLYIFQKAWWSMTFPLGTMAIGILEFFKTFNQYAPMGAFRVVSAIYSVSCVLITVVCLIGTISKVIPQWHKFLRENGKPTDLSTEDFEKRVSEGSSS